MRSHVSSFNQMARRTLRSLTPSARSIERMLVTTLALCLAQPAIAQTFTVLHSFTGGNDGAYPFAGLTLDHAGNVYGTAAAGALGYGTVFKMTHREQGWIFAPLYRFDGNDGADPESPVIFGSDGAVYGTTRRGGPQDAGTVFRLTPASTRCGGSFCPWIEKLLYAFHGGLDGSSPQGHLAFDQAGRLYGAAPGMHVSGERGPGDGAPGCIWQLVRSSTGWDFHLVHAFSNYGDDGTNPREGVVIDAAGRLYGTTPFGGTWDWGTVFEMTPAEGGWSERILHNFTPLEGGTLPQAGLVADRTGNLIGATFIGAFAFELMRDGDDWDFRTTVRVSSADGPYSTLAADAEGHFYGATVDGGRYGQGNIFELSDMNGIWTYRNLYDFTGGEDGGQPFGTVVVDSTGTIYGTAAYGGTRGYGTAWILRP